MSGRGDKNKLGTSGQGAGNQSGQGFTQTPDRQKSNHGEQTGGKPSKPQPKTKDDSGDRTAGNEKEKN